MAEVAIDVGGRRYTVNCRDGEQDHLLSIAQLVDAKARDAERAVGGVNETRSLLLAALLLADELADARNGIAPPPQPAAPPAPPAALQPDYAPIIEKLAARIESLAERLEGGLQNP